MLWSLPGGVPGKFLLPESQRVDDNASHVFTITRNVYLQTPLQIYLAGKGKLLSHQYYFCFASNRRRKMDYLEYLHLVHTCESCTRAILNVTGSIRDMHKMSVDQLCIVV